MEYKKIRKIVYFALLVTISPFLLLFAIENSANTPMTLVLIGSIAGFIGAIILLWQVILGLRFLSTKISKDLVWFNKLHKKLGIYGTVLIFLHPILKAVTYSGSIKLVFFPNFSDPLWLEISYGRIAFSLLLVVWVTSAFFRKKMGFRLWKHIHFLAYLILFFVFLHSGPIGTYLNTYPILMAYWNALAVIFYLIVLYRIYKFLGFGYAKYKLLDKEQVGDVFIYSFEALDKNVFPDAGQFCYIKMKKHFGEEHPFTVMESYPNKRQLTFGIKAQGKYTKKLSELEIGSVVLLDGPFGVFTLEGHDSKPKVIIAGGIGVTPFVDLVKKFGNENTYMFNANRELGLAVERDQLKEKLGERYVDVIDKEKVSGKNVINGTLTEELTREYLPENIIENAVYFICGPKSFYEKYKKMLLKMKISRESIFYEEFGF